MTTTIYVKNNREYMEIKKQIKIYKTLPKNTRIVFLKKKVKKSIKI